MSCVRVLLAEDHTIVRKGLLALLNEADDIKVCGEVENGHEAIKAVAKLLPEVVVLDITMPILNGLEAARRIRSRFPKCRVVFLTMHASEGYLREALLIGAAGFVLKRAAPEELLLAVRAAAEGQKFISPALSNSVVDGYVGNLAGGMSGNQLDNLTGREREILQLIAEGMTSAAIAEHLHLSIKTISAHRSNLMGKLNAHCTADLVMHAIRFGLVIPDVQ